MGEWRGEELKNTLGHDCRMRGGIGWWMLFDISITNQLIYWDQSYCDELNQKYFYSPVSKPATFALVDLTKCHDKGVFRKGLNDEFRSIHINFQNCLDVVDVIFPLSLLILQIKINATKREQRSSVGSHFNIWFGLFPTSQPPRSSNTANFCPNVYSCSIAIYWNIIQWILARINSPRLDYEHI